MGRVVLMVTIWPTEAQTSGFLRLTDADSEQVVPVQRGSFVLTLEREPDASFARGHLRSTADGADYPIQTTTRLFEALKAYMSQGR
jgi:hypothetical protein